MPGRQLHHHRHRARHRSHRQHRLQTARLGLLPSTYESHGANLPALLLAVGHAYSASANRLQAAKIKKAQKHVAYYPNLSKKHFPATVCFSFSYVNSIQNQE